MRARPEISRTSGLYFFLVLVLSNSWRVKHIARGRLGPGDLFFYDSRYPLDSEFQLNWRCFNLRLSEQFARKWLPNPAWLGGRILSDSKWGRVLASYVAQLSPEFVVQAPLPQAMLIDQLGALLALAAAEISGGRATSSPIERSLRDQIFDHINQRLPRNISAGGRHREFAQHFQANSTSGAGSLRGNIRCDANPSARRCRRTHASITALRSSDHGGDWETRGILGRLPLY